MIRTELLAKRRVLYSLLLSCELLFIANTHLLPNALIFLGNGTAIQVSFSFKAYFSSAKTFFIFLRRDLRLPRYQSSVQSQLYTLSIGVVASFRWFVADYPPYLTAC